MAVLFPTQFGQVLDPKKNAQLLQGFLNIQNVEGVTDGQLTKSDLASYGQKRFLAADPSSAVAGYLNKNFDAIAKLDGDANSISVDDLVQIRKELPKPDPVTQPPAQNPPPTMSDNMQLILFFFVQLFQQMFQRTGVA
jgi:hypothetical protein